MNDSRKSITLAVGWIMLLVMGALMALGGVESLMVAYRSGGPLISGMTSQELSAINPDLPSALRGRRATAASLSVICGVLVAWIALVPYRKAEKWAWWALLSSVGPGAVLSLLRMQALGTRVGAGVAGVFLVWLLLALAISYRDMR